MPIEKITYLCSICKTEYSDFNDAVSCEARDIQPFKFQVGKLVSVVSKGDVLPPGRRYYPAKIVQQKRRLEGNRHTNWYEVQFIGHHDLHGMYRENEIEEP